MGLGEGVSGGTWHTPEQTAEVHLRRIEAVGSGVGVHEAYGGDYLKLQIKFENGVIFVGCTAVTVEAWRRLEEKINGLLAKSKS